MRVLQNGVALSGGARPDRQSCAFPGVCVSPDGRWIVTCRAAPQKVPLRGQHVLLAFSDDEGNSWSEPHKSFAGVTVSMTPGTFRAAYLTPLGGEAIAAVLLWVENGDEDLPFFNEATQGLLDCRIFLAHSTDSGTCWTLPVEIPTQNVQFSTPITGPLLILPNGEWVCQFELNKPYDSPEEWRHSSVLIFSRDEGKSWPEQAISSNDPENRVFYWDQRPGLTKNGDLIDFFWTFDNETAAYLPIHARRSDDAGRSWSPMWNTGICGQPAAPVTLSDGRIVLVFVDREGPPRLCARVSADEGVSWSDEILVLDETNASQTEEKGEMNDAWSEMGAFSLGLPATAALPGDEVLVVYYAGQSADATEIRWARVGME